MKYETILGVTIRLFFASLLFLATTIVVAPLPTLAAPTVAEKVWRSSYILFALDNQKWRPVCMATPFETSPDRTFFVTASHCLIGSAYAIGPEIKIRPFEPVPAKIEYDQRIGDIAVVSIAVQLPTLKLGTLPYPGDEVIAVVAPSGRRKLMAAGIIASFPDRFDTHSSIAVHLSAWVGGVSGGAIYCVEQEAICAIISGHWTDIPFYTATTSIENLMEGKWREK